MNSTNDKSREFRNVAIGQILFMVYAIILEPEVQEPLNSILFFLVINVFTISSYLMLRRLTSRRLVRLLSISLIILADSIGAFLSIAIPMGLNPTSEINLIILSLVDGSLMTACAITAYYTAKEIFFEETTIKERIWGATCAYLYIGFAFANIYDFMLFFEQFDLMGNKDTEGFSIYSQAITYSMNMMGGLDSVFPNVPFILSKVAILESIISHLFVVLIIGRLLAK